MKLKIIIMTVLVIICIASSASAVDQLFDTPMLYFSYAGAKGYGIGDFNDDGILDVAHAQGFTKMILIHLGNGDGTFESQYPDSLDNWTTPDIIRVGDMNNDGLDDIVTCDAGGTSYIRIFYSDSSSNAEPNLPVTPTFYAVSASGWYVELIDVNKDGWLDILFGDGKAIYNNGDETFTDPTNIGAGNINNLWTADVNHDGYPDFVTSWALGELWVTLSEGVGGYHTADTISVTDKVFLSSNLLVDLTGDGELDIVFTGMEAVGIYWVEIAINLGDGVFADGVKYDILPTGYNSFTVGNIDGDDLNDIVAVNTSPITDYTYAVLINNGNLTFDPPVVYQGDYRLGALRAVDFNGDGYDDIIGHGWTAMAVYLNHGDGTFPLTSDIIDIPWATMMMETYSYDFNADTYPDIIVLAQNGVGGAFIARIYYNDGSGNFGSTFDQISVPYVDYYKSTISDYLVCGDFIGDGSTDVVFCGRDGYAVYTGPIVDGNFTTVEDFDFSNNTVPVGIAADVDRDNDLDLVLSGPSASLMVKYNANGVHTFDTTFELVTNSYITSIDTLDIDNDGDLDFFIGSQNFDKCYTVENDGDGNLSALQQMTLSKPATGQAPYASKLIDVVAADFNGDGYGDAAVLWYHLMSQTTGLIAPVIYLMMNDGAGTLYLADTLDYHTQAARRVFATDIDNDGDFDLTLTGDYPRGAAVLINDGTASFSPPITYGAVGPGGRGVDLTANDFDLDGNIDIAHLQYKNANTNTNGTVVILRNTGFASGPAYVCGDSNGDERVNIADAVFLINLVFKGGPSPDPIEAGDANCDDRVNISDAVYLINLVFKGGPEACEWCKK
ncbi:MAG: FG-GAP-like repeat-containing protein [Candidatus Zixiibacteriota bacterium]